MLAYIIPILWTTRQAQNPTARKYVFDVTSVGQVRRHGHEIQWHKISPRVQVPFSLGTISGLRQIELTYQEVSRLSIEFLGRTGKTYLMQWPLRWWPHDCGSVAVYLWISTCTVFPQTCSLSLNPRIRAPLTGPTSPRRRPVGCWAWVPSQIVSPAYSVVQSLPCQRSRQNPLKGTTMIRR